MNKLIVFTDLDGTLLCHDSYDWKAATPAINALKEHGYPLILNSSKTSREIKQLRTELGINDPYICENGALVHFNETLQQNGNTSMATVLFAKPHSYVKDIIDEIRASHGFAMRCFSDMDVSNLMQLTGLDKQSAMAANQREATEPLQWNDSNKALDNFKTKLAEFDLILSRGGRFFHVSSPVSKGDSIRWLLKRYRIRYPTTHWVSVGLGDSYNDISMFEQVDIPILINNPQTKKPDVSHIKNIIESSLAGPEGWNTEILKIINTLEETAYG